MNKRTQTQFRSKGEIKESLHTFVNEITKRKIEAVVAKKLITKGNTSQSMGEVIDEIVKEHIRKDGVII